MVQHTAGKDVFRSQGKSGTPSRSFLFDPASNIDTGTAYLAMLNNVYLGGIDNPTSRRYAVITAYNGGAGSVLRVFSNDKIQAANIINTMTPGDVYQTLTTRHPSAESRRYLYKSEYRAKILPPPIIPLTAPDDAQGQKCYPHHNFVLQIGNVCNYLPQVTKKPVREVDRIPSSRTVKCAFSNTHPHHDVRKLT